MTKMTRLSLVGLTVLLAAAGHCYQLPDGGKIWALLVAGSNYYSNYRHQADVCHAYQILHKNGIPDENIIVMMYDDIANNPDNPRKGVIINRPKGENVYKGVPKDYTGEDVNPKNFLKVLSGDEEGMKGIGSGRVLKPGPKDHVFVNFVDHGAPGLLAFPSSELLADDLAKVLQKMVDNNQFAKMVLFIEACESGSMFENILPDDESIFVMTAADPKESSYACYYDQEFQTYLGDVFSVRWMENVEMKEMANSSLHHLYQKVRAETPKSHVEEYGNMDLGSLPVSDFIGIQTGRLQKTSQFPIRIQGAVPSQDVPLAHVQRQVESTVDPERKEKLQLKLYKMMKLRKQMEATVKMILQNLFGEDKKLIQAALDGKLSFTRENFGCYRKVITHFSEVCYNFSKNPYALRQLYVFKNLCAEGLVEDTEVISAMDKICTNMNSQEEIV